MTKIRLLLLWAAACFLGACAEENDEFEYQTHVVQQGDLRITIRQKGTIEAREPVSINNPIEGNSTILDVIAEGTFVKKGDFIFSLDVSNQRDKLLQQKISTSNSQQVFFNAEQQLEITKQQNESNFKQAELKVLFAELDKKQYLEGDLPRERDGVEAEITLAREERERSKETLSWSVKLAAKGYISKDKLDADRLMVKRRDIEEDLAKKKLAVLNDYTAVKRKRELDSQLDEAKRELARVSARCKASLSQKEADVRARRAQYQLETKKLERLEHQVTNNRVVAPRDGIVIYAREGGRRDRKPIEAGSTVRKGQTICEIPDMDRVLVDVDVHESSVHMVDLKMPVIVTTDTGETITGEIESVATIADSQSWYRNPDLKVYSTSVTIDNPGRKLKPGMNCFAEIIVDELKNVVSVPVQAIHDNGQKTFCYVNVDGQPDLREVEVGMHNNELIHVKSGLAPGEHVFLAPPADAKAVPLADAKQGKRKVAKKKPRPAKAAQDMSKSAGATKGSQGDAAKARRGEQGGRPKFDMEAWNKMSDEEKAAMRKKWEDLRKSQSQ